MIKTHRMTAEQKGWCRESNTDCGSQGVRQAPVERLAGYCLFLTQGHEAPWSNPTRRVES
jgi:hypothetical protein